MNLFILLIIISLIFIFVNFKKHNKPINKQELFGNDDIIMVHNSYLSDKTEHTENTEIKWISNKTCTYVNENWPNTFDWDYNIKKDIIQQSLKIPNNSAIIDAGAHIGDGVIPIAHALKYHGRDDIEVVAIEPCKTKCEFIRKLCEINNLDNVNIINTGISDKKKILKKGRLPFWWNIINNTGATKWYSDDDKPLYDKITDTFMSEHTKEYISCDTIDNLVLQGKIKHPIRLIHLDLEGGERDALIGASKTLDKYKPYLSVEFEYLSPIKYINYIPSIYKQTKQINRNLIYKI